MAAPSDPTRPGRAYELLGLGEARYTAPEIADKAGIELEEARRLWRAMGFPHPGDEPIFTDADLEVLTRLLGFIRGGLTDMDTTLAMTRVVSQALARVADAQAEVMKERFAEPAAEAALELGPELFPALESFLTHTWRRHLAVALERLQTFATDDGHGTTVGFADIVGFTPLSRHSDDRELLRVVERLETRAQEVVSSVGGRVVKTIGDEVMFTTDDPGDAAEIALNLVEDFAADDELPDVRVGLARGPVLSHRGDVVGPTVNLASRAAGAARPATVLASEDVKAALADVAEWELKPTRRRHLKGIGPTRLWVLRRRAA